MILAMVVDYVELLVAIAAGWTLVFFVSRLLTNVHFGIRYVLWAWLLASSIWSTWLYVDLTLIRGQWAEFNPIVAVFEFVLNPFLLLNLSIQYMIKQIGQLI